MSYLRGDIYIWSSGDRFHVWVADGYDSWNESGWGEGCSSPDTQASGVGIPEAALDEFVVMRLAELIQNGAFDSAVERALSHGKGNGGCEALARSSERLRSALASIPILNSQSSDVPETLAH